MTTPNTSAVRDLFTKELTCPGGAAVNDLVYLSGSGAVSLASAVDPSTANYLGFIVSKPSTTKCIVQTAGSNEFLVSLAAGATYYLSDTPGQLSLTPGTNTVIVGVAIDGTTLTMVPGGVALSGAVLVSGPFVAGAGTPSARLTGTSTASANYAVSEGAGCVASGVYAHAEGYNTTAHGQGGHAEGYDTTADGHYAHAEGHGTNAYEVGHAEGIQSLAGIGGHAENLYTYAILGSHAEGYHSRAVGYSHAEGKYTIAIPNGPGPGAAHAEGLSTYASNHVAHAEGAFTLASGSTAHAEGFQSIASGIGSHSEGYQTTASGASSHAEGHTTIASGKYSHSEGFNTTATTYAAHAEGTHTTAAGYSAHAEGYSTQAPAPGAHAEGYYSQSNGTASHAEGSGTYAQADYSHAGGRSAVASMRGQWSRSSNHLTAAGDVQVSILTLIRRTTDATPTILSLDGTNPGPGNRLAVAIGQALGCEICIVGKSSADVIYFRRSLLIQNIGGTTALVGAVQTDGTDFASGGAGAWAVAITADNANDALQIEVTGAAATTINWIARIDTTEVSLVP